MTDTPQSDPTTDRKSSGIPKDSHAEIRGARINVGAALCYLIVPAVLYLIVSSYRTHTFLRFHSIQAISVIVVAIGCEVIFGMMPILSSALLFLLPIFVAAVLIICAVMAAQDKDFKLPIIGDFAEEQAKSTLSS